MRMPAEKSAAPAYWYSPSSGWFCHEPGHEFGKRGKRRRNPNLGGVEHDYAVDGVQDGVVNADEYSRGNWESLIDHANPDTLLERSTTRHCQEELLNGCKAIVSRTSGRDGRLNGVVQLVEELRSPEREESILKEWAMQGRLIQGSVHREVTAKIGRIRQMDV
jgi:hypothetical protein